jgi:hypothetical protein
MVSIFALCSEEFGLNLHSETIFPDWSFPMSFHAVAVMMMMVIMMVVMIGCDNFQSHSSRFIVYVLLILWLPIKNFWHPEWPPEEKNLSVVISYLVFLSCHKTSTNSKRHKIFYFVTRRWKLYMKHHVGCN